MRLWIQNPHLLNLDLVAAAGHELVDRQEAAQVAIGSASVPHRVDPRRVIMLYLEPPLGQGYSTIYGRASTFRAFGCLVDLSLPNSFLLTQDPIVYPYGVHALRDRRREDTTIRTRRVFYAGTRVGHPPGGDGDYGRVALYKTRNDTVLGLRALGVDVYAEGVGWEQSTRHEPNWDEIKGHRIDEVMADFHLCMENSRMQGYISEKIHHGFQSDRVVLYLGCSRIHEHVPAGAFINLNDHFDPRTRQLDLVEVARRLQGMTQEQYDDILRVARHWRSVDMLEERFNAERDRVTRQVLLFL